MSKQENNQPKELFRHVRYWISPYLPLNLRKKLRQHLDTNGAFPSHSKENEESQASHPIFDLDQLTHLVTLSWQFPGYQKVMKHTRHVRVVTPNWVFDTIKQKKRLSSSLYSPEPMRFFSGITILAAQLPQSDIEKIYGSALCFGGNWRNYITKDVTHFITLSEDNEYYKKINRMETKIKTVTPHWVEDCVRFGKFIPEDNYLFPDPNIFKIDQDLENQNSLSTYHSTYFIPFNFKIQSYIQESISSMNEWEMGLKLKPFTFYLDEDLELTEDHLIELKKQLNQLGATLVSIFDISKVTCYICRSRDSKYYDLAYKNDLMIGNVTWLFHLIIEPIISPPTAHLLFYPKRNQPILEMKNFYISITNYYDKNKEYLIQLMKLMGIKYTPYLTNKNTHLICASPKGDKYNKALEWNIPILNHLWLEDCFRTWTLNPITKSKYTFFPLGIDLNQLILIAPYLPKDIYPDIGEKIHDPVIQVEDSDKEIQNSKDIQLPTVAELFETSICNIESKQGDDEADITPIDNTITPIRTSKRAAASQAHTSLIKLMCLQNEFERTCRGKLNKFSTPAPPIGGKVEENALLLPKSIEKAEEDNSMIELSEKPKLSAKRQKQEPPTHLEAVTPRKRGIKISVEIPKINLDIKRNSHANEVIVEEGRNSRKAKESNPPTEVNNHGKSETKPLIKLLFTGIKPNAQEKKKIKGLGMRIMETTEDFSHLVASSASRTAKFLCAIAGGKPIVTMQWIHDCIKKQKILSETTYLLKDEKSEKQLGFNLEESLERARQRKLLEDLHFTFTPNVQPDADTLTQIILAGGGKVISLPTRRQLQDLETTQVSNFNLIILASKKDQSYIVSRLGKQWFNEEEDKLTNEKSKMKSKKTFQIQVFLPEILLSGTLNQKFTLDENFRIKI